MNKKLFLIPIAIGIVVMIAINIIKPEEPHGLNFKMETPQMETISKGALKSVDLYLDGSMSMKGYVDFSRANSDEFKEAQKSMVRTLNSFLSKVYMEWDVEGKCHCNGRQYNRDRFRDALQNGSIFSGGTSDLGKMVKDVCSQMQDSTVAVIVSDMVLSFGSAKLRADIDYNLHERDQLYSVIQDAFIDASKRGMSVMMVQYLSDFNGNYYYNYQENLEGSGAKYKRHCMKHRPFYMLFVGEESQLKSIANSGHLGNFENIYSPFDVKLSTQDYLVEIDQRESAWRVEVLDAWDPSQQAKAKSKLGNIWIDSNDSSSNTFTFKSSQGVSIPKYLGVELSELQCQYDPAVIQSVSPISGADGGVILFDVTVKKTEALFADDSRQEAEICFYSDRNGGAKISIDDDVTPEIEELEGKTWGVGAIIEALYAAYKADPQRHQDIIKCKFEVSNY